MEIAGDIACIFKENPEAAKQFGIMSYTHRKEYIRWISEAKKPEIRENRKNRMIKMILAGKKGL